MALGFFQPNNKLSEEKNFVNSVYSSVNVESVKNVTFDFLNTSHLEENVQSSHSLASRPIIQEDVKYDTHSIINQNGSSVDEAHIQQNNSNFDIVTETKAICVYTNTDQLRNKMYELDILITQEKMDFIFVTEVLPKSTICTEISYSSVLYNINGYEAFPSQDGGRGVMIYARTG